MQLGEINNLIFNSIEVENDFRELLKLRFAEEDLFYLFNADINFVDMDIDGKTDIELPAVTIEVEQSGYKSKDDFQIQTYTPFLVEINVYTSGSNKVYNNKYLCNEIIKLLQSNGQLPHYYCRGLRIEENLAVDTLIDSAYRRIIRMSAVCDNELKLIR